MPEIPTFVSTQGYGSGVAPGGTIPLAAGGSGAGALAEGFDRVSAQFAQVAAHTAAQAAALEAAKIDGDVAMQVADMTEKYRTDQDPSTAGARFREEMLALHRTTTAGITNPMVRQRVEMNLAQRGPVAYTHVLTNAAKYQQQITAEGILNAGSEAAKQLAAASDPASVELAVQQITQAYGSAEGVRAMTPEQRRINMSKDFANGIMLVAQTDTQRAAMMTEQLRGRLDSQHLLQIETAIKGTNNRITGQSIGQDVFDGRSGPSAPTMPSAPADPSQPRGIRNNNPLNLEYRSDQGATGTDGRFGVYATMEQGVAAAQRQLLLNQDRGLNTVAKQIGRWAPPSENNTGAYVATVARALGVGPNDPIDVRDPKTAAAMIGAMAQVENGKPIDQEAIQRGVAGHGIPVSDAGAGRVQYAASGQTTNDASGFITDEQVVETGGFNVGDTVGQPAPSPGAPPERTYSDMVREVIRRTNGNPQAQAAALSQLEYLHSARRADEADAARRAQEQHRAVIEASNNDETRVIADTFGKGDNPGITAGQIADPRGPYAALTPDARRQMIGFMERQTRPDPVAQVSAATSARLLQDMRASEGDPHRITTTGPIFDAYTAGKLSRADFTFLQEQFKTMGNDEGQKITQETKRLIDAVKPLIDKSNPLAGQLDETGAMRTMLYERMVQDRVAQYRKEGKNPYDLFNPQNPAWLGAPGVVAPYQHTMQNSMEQMLKGLAPAPGRPSIWRNPAGAPRPSLDSIFGTTPARRE